MPPANSSLRVRLGYFEDFTTVPVTMGLEGMVRSAAVRRGSPEEIVEAIRNDDLDGGLVPSASALTLRNHALIPAAAVTTLGASRCMMVFANKLPAEITRVLVEPNDLGATPLARLLFPKKLMARPEFLASDQPLDPATFDFNADHGVDAFLLTGRNALLMRKDAFSFQWDMTLAWYEYTRTPFVMHCWVIRKGLNVSRLEKELLEVVKRQESRIDAAGKVAERYRLGESSVRTVFERGFMTEFNTMVLTSLRRYGKELAQARILPTIPLQVYTESSSRRATGA